MKKQQKVKPRRFKRDVAPNVGYFPRSKPYPSIYPLLKDDQEERVEPWTPILEEDGQNQLSHPVALKRRATSPVQVDDNVIEFIGKRKAPNPLEEEDLDPVQVGDHNSLVVVVEEAPPSPAKIGENSSQVEVEENPNSHIVAEEDGPDEMQTPGVTLDSSLPIGAIYIPPELKQAAVVNSWRIMGNIGREVIKRMQWANEEAGRNGFNFQKRKPRKIRGKTITRVQRYDPGTVVYNFSQLARRNMYPNVCSDTLEKAAKWVNISRNGWAHHEYIKLLRHPDILLSAFFFIAGPDVLNMPEIVAQVTDLCDRAQLTITTTF